MNFFERLFGKKKVVHDFRVGERDDNGYAFVYKDGEKTNLRMLLWDAEEVDRLRKIGEQIQKERRLKK